MPRNILKKLTTEELKNMFLEYQKKLDNMLSNINAGLTFLKHNENGISVFSNKDSEW